MNLNKERIEFFDVLKGIAICSVVVIHTCSLGIQSHLNLSWDIYFLCVLRQIVTFAVPLFLFIAGYWNAKYEFKAINDSLAFFKKRLIRVGVPYLFWSVIVILLSKGSDDEWHLKRYVFDLLFGRVSVYYFMILLIQFYLLTPVFKYINRNWVVGFWIITLLNVFGLGILYYLRLVANIELPFSQYAVFFVMWCIFYQLGLFIGTHINEFEFWLRKYRLYITIGSIGSLILVIIEAFALLPYSQQAAFSTLRFTSFLYTIFVILMVFMIRTWLEVHAKYFAKIGQISFGLYLTHMFIITFLISKIPESISQQQVFYQIALSGSVVFIGYVIIKVCQRILPRPINQWLLGFGN